jgi:hypothetical protein
LARNELAVHDELADLLDRSLGQWRCHNDPSCRDATLLRRRWLQHKQGLDI